VKRNQEWKSCYLYYFLWYHWSQVPRTRWCNGITTWWFYYPGHSRRVGSEKGFRFIKR